MDSGNKAGDMSQTIFRILSRVSLVASVSAAALVFMLDRRAPLGLTIGALYVFPLLLSLLADRRRNTLGVAWLCSVLVVLGYW